LITIPQSDLTLVSGTRYQITVDFLWQLLREFADDATGAAPQINTYRRTAATASTPAITEINDPIYVAQFENGNYSVDIINGNTNWQDVEVKNNVSVGTNNTTGFINPEFLELGLFGGQICIDQQNETGSAVLGTDKTPQGAIIGTRQAPCLDFEQAQTIGMVRGINQFNLMSNCVLTGGNFSAGYSWTADRRQILLTAEVNADVSGNSMRDLTITGEMDGLNSVERCDIQAVTNVSGNIFQCNLDSTIGITGPTQINQCFSSVAGSGYPTITNIGNHELVVRDMRGSLGLAGMTGGIHSIGLYGGRLVLEDTCIGGEVHARGDPFEIINNAASVVDLFDETGEAQIKEIYQRLDLDPDKPNTYTNDDQD
jgi:hypothetical protein